MKSLNILLDECIDWRLSKNILGHRVSSVHQASLTGLKNGELLKKSEREFDVFVTVDRNLTSQQNLKKFDIAVVVLRCKSNRLSDLQLLIPGLLTALQDVSPYTVTIVGE